MNKVKILRDVSWQTLAVIEPFIPYFCAIFQCHLDRCLFIGYKTKDAADGGCRGLCRRSEVCVNLRMTVVALSGHLGEEELMISAHLPQISAEVLLYPSCNSSMLWVLWSPAGAVGVLLRKAVKVGKVPFRASTAKHCCFADGSVEMERWEWCLLLYNNPHMVFGFGFVLVGWLFFVF